MIDSALINQIQNQVEQNRSNIIQFFKDIVAIPSHDSLIGPVGQRISLEMKKLAFDEIRFDKMGNILGRIGDGPRTIVFDSHIDTVGIGDPSSWKWDPFLGKIEGDQFFARGTCDEKGSTPGMIYGLAIANKLGLLEGWTAYYFGNMEEWCDGIAPNSFATVDPGISPDFVIIGEPTKMSVYRGHKGRIELKITAKGKSAHAASNHLGINAIYLLLPIIEKIRDLEPELGNDPFLGHGKITVSDMHVKTPSINAVPDEAQIFIDRRLTFGESKEEALNQIQALIPAKLKDFITVEMLYYDQPSYTGFVFPVEKYFPSWTIEEDHPLVQAGLQVRTLIGLPEKEAGKWDFSTNGIYWAGKAKIPSIGFGPGDEKTAHTIDECVSLNDVVKSTMFYALISHLIP